MAQKEHVSKTPLLNMDFPNSGLVLKFPLAFSMHLIDLAVMINYFFIVSVMGKRKKDSLQISQKNVQFLEI